MVGDQQRLRLVLVTWRRTMVVGQLWIGTQSVVAHDSIDYPGGTRGAVDLPRWIEVVSARLMVWVLYTASRRVMTMQAAPGPPPETRAPAPRRPSPMVQKAHSGGLRAAAGGRL